MPLTVTADLITRDRTTRTNRPVAGHPPARQLTWRPDQSTRSPDREATRR